MKKQIFLLHISLTVFILFSCGQKESLTNSSIASEAIFTHAASKKQSDGHEVGNGVDKVKEPIAWFIGDKKIYYCTKIHPNFGQRNSRIHFLIEKAFHQWISYIIERGVNNENVSNFDYAPPLATKIKFTSNCDRADLVFYFGMKNEKIDQVISIIMLPMQYLI